jgi:hypothetical protein
MTFAIDWFKEHSPICRPGFGRRLLILSLITIVPCIILGRLLIGIRGYLNWGNFVVPPTSTQLANDWLVWNPYQANGFVYFSPGANVSEFALFNVPVYVMSWAVGYEAALLLYILASIILLAFAFYLLSGFVTASTYPRAVATLFFLANPLTLQLISAGDFIQFVSEAAVLLSIVALIVAIRRGPSVGSYALVAVSICLFAACCDFPQLVYIGWAVWVGTGILVTLQKTGLRTSMAYRGVLRMAAYAGALTLSLSYFLLPLFATGYSYSGTSASATPLSQFQSSSSPVLDMFLLRGYPPNLGWSSVQGAYPNLYAAWFFAAAIVIILAVSAVIRRPGGKSLVLTSVLLIGCILGSGAAGPASGVTSYLYLHMPGYALLDASYYWDWIVVLPAEALLLAISLSPSVQPRKIGTLHAKIVNRGADLVSSIRQRLPTKSRLSSSLAIRGAAIGLVLAVVAMPIAGQGYYGSYNNNVYGIHSTYLPPNFSQLVADVKGAVGGTSTGIAILNPDDYVTFANQSQPSSDPLVLYPDGRTVGLPFGAVGSNVADYYFFWLYQQLYEGHTRYFGQLMGLEGVSVFVVLFDSESASYFPYYMPWSYGVNASILMEEQVGVSSVLVTSDYQIFRATQIVPVASLDRTQTLVLGSYETLAQLPYLGVNLTGRAINFDSDLGSGPELPLSQTSLVVVNGPTPLTDLAMQGQSVTLADPVPYVTGSATQESGWVSTYSIAALGDPYTDSLPYPIAASFIPNSVLNLPLEVSRSGQYELWLDLLFTSNGGPLSLELDGRLLSEVNTTATSFNSTDQLAWIHFNVSLGGGTHSLRLITHSAVTGIRMAALAPFGYVEGAVNNVSQQLRSWRIPTIDMYGSDELAISDPNAFHGSFPTDAIPGGDYLFLGNSYGTSPVTLDLTFPTPDSNGTLVLETLANGWQELREGSAGQSVSIGFISGQYNLSDSGWGQVSLTVPCSQVQCRVNLTLSGGTEFLAWVALVPPGAVRAISTTSMNLAEPTSINLSHYTANLTLSLSNGPHATDISGSFKYSGSAPPLTQLISLSFNTSILTESIELAGTVHGDVFAAFDGLQISGSGVDSSVRYQGQFGIDSYLGVPQPSSVYFLPTLARIAGPETVLFNFSVAAVSPPYAPLPQVDPDQLTGNVTVSYTQSGYSLSCSCEGAFLLVRTPFIAGSYVVGDDGSILPGGGGMTTIITFNGTASAFQIEVRSWLFLEVGIVASIVSPLCVFVFGLVTLRRFRNAEARRRSEVRPSQLRAIHGTR